MPEAITVIPTYNAEHFLPATLDCIAAQSRRPDRVIVIDNGSTDSTESLVRNHPSLRIEWLRNPTNIGVLGNLNRCLSFADQTDFLHLLMADDLVRPAFFERSLAALRDIPGQALSYVLDDKINQYGRVVLPAIVPPGGRARTVPPAEFIRRQSALDTVLLPGVLFKTDRRPIPTQFGNFPQVADTVFLGECSHLGMTIVEVPEALCEYRLSNLNASSRHRTHLETFVRDEWRAMTTIAAWIPEPAWRRPITRALLRLRFAARTEVKRQLFAGANPEYARDVDAVRREIGGLVLGTAGVAAVRARDLVRRLQGQPTRLQEFERLQDAGKP
jgi:glycosyltransferase involved in cell wall biosynthesis